MQAPNVNFGSPGSSSGESGNGNGAGDDAEKDWNSGVKNDWRQFLKQKRKGFR